MELILYMRYVGILKTIPCYKALKEIYIYSNFNRNKKIHCKAFNGDVLGKNWNPLNNLIISCGEVKTANIKIKTNIEDNYTILTIIIMLLQLLNGHQMVTIFLLSLFKWHDFFDISGWPH